MSASVRYKIIYGSDGSVWHRRRMVASLSVQDEAGVILVYAAGPIKELGNDIFLAIYWTLK